MKISHEQLLGTKLETASIDQEIDIKASRNCSRGFVEHPQEIDYWGLSRLNSRPIQEACPTTVPPNLDVIAA